ncbi:MAG: rhomboid family intramembrane serine protease [Candidatus Nitrosocaldus sp.]|nr:rhomboid family intramembrane serine protease [Candidatus Nitrosocaldus sp.]MDW8275000.1 rhomboid family intramembrane serine protease [Candidatus Nitrosocaldus sp.]
MLPPVTLILLAINIIVFVSIQGTNWYTFGSIPSYLVNDPQMFLVTSFTSMFLHANVVHIAFNMLALVALGRVIEETIGSVRYTIAYMISGLSGVALHTIYSLATGIGLNTPMVGASGAISGIIGLAAALGDRFAYIWLGVQFVFAIAGLSSIAYFAHIGGFILGFLLGRLYRHRMYKDDTYLL